MSATYDPTLATDKDKVRFLLGDTTTSSALLTDAEIEAVASLEENYWLAAAVCGEAVLARWTAQTGGLEEKQVETLRVRWGGAAGSPQARFQDKLQQYREKGAAATIADHAHFRVV